MHVTDPWEPMLLEQIVRLFANAPFRWWISGGVALELFAGRTWRAHEDADVGLIRRDAPLVRDWLTDWDLAVADEGVLSPWRGEPLLPTQNNVWMRRAGGSVWLLDLTIGAGDDQQWIYRRDSRIVRPWDEAVLYSPGGVPYLAPDLQILFKSKDPRPKDDNDVLQAAPLLGPSQRRFLLGHLPSEHPWRKVLDR